MLEQMQIRSNSYRISLKSSFQIVQGGSGTGDISIRVYGRLYSQLDEVIR